MFRFCLLVCSLIGLFVFCFANLLAQDSNANFKSRLWNIEVVKDSLSAKSVSPDLQMKMELHSIPLPDIKRIPILEENKLRISSTTYIISSAAILSGGIAATAKLHSDKLYKQYLSEYYSTGIMNSNKKKDVKRYDTISAVALVAAELGFVYLSFSLLNY